MTWSKYFLRSWTQISPKYLIWPPFFRAQEMWSQSIIFDTIKIPWKNDIFRFIEFITGLNLRLCKLTIYEFCKEYVGITYESYNMTDIKYYTFTWVKAIDVINLISYAGVLEIAQKVIEGGIVTWRHMHEILRWLNFKLAQNLRSRVKTSRWLTFSDQKLWDSSKFE